MTFQNRRPALLLPPLARASRWSDVAAANEWTTRTLRHHEPRLRAAAARGEAHVEFRAPVPPAAGSLFVRDTDDVLPRPVSCAVVRMDLSAAPAVRASYPEDLPLLADAWDLLQLLTCFREDAVEDWYDPRQAVDAVLAGDPARAAAASGQWRHLTGGSTADDAVARVVHDAVGARVRPVEGTSWSAWATWFTEHLDRVAAVPLPVTAVDAAPPHATRSGEFDGTTDLASLVEAVIERRAAPVRAWADDPRRPSRLHVWADLGTVVGTVSTTSPDLDVAATAVAVVLQRDPQGGHVVLDAHPELPLDDGLRDRHPLAGSLLGAYFGPGTSRVDVRPWLGQRALLADEPAAVLAAFGQEVNALLTLDDATLAQALIRLGAAVLPAAPRAWLDRFLWRLDAFDHEVPHHRAHP